MKPMIVEMYFVNNMANKEEIYIEQKELTLTAGAISYL
jgi:hypothetical protein